MIINLFRLFGPASWPLVFSKFQKAGLAEGVVETLGNASAGLAPGKAGAGRELPDGAGLKTSHKKSDTKKETQKKTQKKTHTKKDTQSCTQPHKTTQSKHNNISKATQNSIA